jgi:hypothetical protein
METKSVVSTYWMMHQLKFELEVHIIVNGMLEQQ